MKYTAVLERELDGGFVVSVPALPGCVTQGRTKAEAMDNIREAIELYVEDLSAESSNGLDSFSKGKRAVT